MGLLVLSWLGNMAAESDGSGADFSEPRYELSLPKTLVDGKYKLTKDMSDRAEAQNPQFRPGDQGLMGIYDGGSVREQILFTGMNSDATGSSSDDKVLDGMEQDPTVDVAVPRKEITPEGAEEPLTCEVMTKSEGGRKLSMATCAWSNNGSAAAVADNSYDSVLAEPEDIDLESFARRVDTIRDEVRSPA